jgi:hypothetical protein
VEVYVLIKLLINQKYHTVDALKKKAIARYQDFLTRLRKGYKDDYQEKVISLETILNRSPIILIGTTTENFVKLVKEIKYGN